MLKQKNRNRNRYPEKQIFYGNEKSIMPDNPAAYSDIIIYKGYDNS